MVSQDECQSHSDRCFRQELWVSIQQTTSSGDCELIDTARHALDHWLACHAAVGVPELVLQTLLIEAAADIEE